jgi:alpha/beta superfamily hydrolase
MTLWIVFGLFASACTPVAVPNQPVLSSPVVVSETPASSADPIKLTGEWIGATTMPDGTTASIQLDFDDTVEAKLGIEPKTETWKIDVTQNGEDVHFSAVRKSSDPFTSIEFTGTLTNESLSGEFNWDDQKSSIVFLQIASVDPSDLEKYEGLYRFESGRALSIIVSPEYSSGGLRFFSQTLMMTDFDSGALRGLYPMDDSTFLIGALRVIGAPFNGRIQFKKDDQGNVQGLMWWETPNDLFSSPVPGFYASRVLYTSEDVTFASQDGTKLAGRFSLPQSNTPLPAFMMLHGSEQGTRDNFGNKVMAHYMINNGFAILNYDKRGVGDSEGTYQEAASPSNLQKHAEDAIAGVEYLASRSEIDAKHISLIGFSQAGWVIPLAASQSTAISHFVILSGPVASTSHESLFSGYTNDGDSIASYDDAKITQQLRDLNPGGFDPLPILAEVDQPGLWLWGSVDKSVPVTYSAENLQGLIDSGKSNFSYDVLPQGDHNLNQSPNGLFSEIPYSPRVLFYSPLTEWLKTHMPVAKE